MPPVAMPGLPVGLTNTRPSGLATTVPRALERDEGAARRPPDAARSRSGRPAPRRSPQPSRRAVSPGCGVRSRGAGAPRQSSRWPASAVSASASTTMGRSTSRTRARTAGLRLRIEREPGAEGDRVHARQQLEDPLAPPSQRASARRSPGRGSVMGSGRWPATTGCCEAGVAHVTRPTPARRAPRQAEHRRAGLADASRRRRGDARSCPCGRRPVAAGEPPGRRRPRPGPS